MKKMSETIVFFGSGPVAAESLMLLAEKFTVEAVVTKPRPLHHKGDVPVISAAEKLGLPVSTAENRSELEELFIKQPFRSRVGVLIDFGIIVSNEIINYFPLGIVNSHFSVLPDLRGADPISFAILSGQKKTGVSLMLLVEHMDEGPLLSYGEYDLPPRITTPELTSELISLSFALLETTLPEYCAGLIEPTPQTITGCQVSYSHKLTKHDGAIDWAKPAVDIEREIRAFIEWPRSHATLGDVEVVVTRAHVVDATGPVGNITTLAGSKLPVIYCGRQALAIEVLKPVGKREMTGEGFLAGYKSRLNLSS